MEVDGLAGEVDGFAGEVGGSIGEVDSEPSNGESKSALNVGSN